MFGWVRSLVVNFKGITVDQAIKNFMKSNSIDEMKDVKVSTLTTTYNRMLKEYFDASKTRQDDEEKKPDAGADDSAN